MALTTPVHTYKSRLYVSQAKETTYGGGGTLTHYIDTEAMEPLRPDLTYVTDRDLSTGYEGAKKQVPIAQRLDRKAIPMWASHNSILWALAYAMGDDAVDATGTNRTHALTMAETTAFPGSMELEQHLLGATTDTDIDFDLVGAYIDTVQLSWGREGVVRQIVTVSSNGKDEGSASQTESGLTNVGVNGWFTANKVRVSFDAAAEGDSTWAGTWTAPSAAGVFANNGGTILSEMIESATFTYENGFLRNRAGGMSTSAGLYGVQPVLGRARRVTLELVLEQEAGVQQFVRDLYASTHANNAEYTVFIEGVQDVAIGSSFYSFGIVMPLTMLVAVPTGGGDIAGLRTESLTFESKEETTSSYKMCYAFVENGTTTVWNQ